jgi:hypothetical protein
MQFLVILIIIAPTIFILSFLQLIFSKNMFLNNFSKSLPFIITIGLILPIIIDGSLSLYMRVSGIVMNSILLILLIFRLYKSLKISQPH